MTGLVAKSRRERQLKSLPKNRYERETKKQIWYGNTKKKICSCGIESAGIFKEGKLRCHECLNPL